MTHPSTRTLDALPAIDDLVRLTKSLAMLDAVLCPEWEYRYYSFDSAWGAGEMMASMRNGSGDDYFILFNKEGAAIKGFDHESPMSPWRTKPPSAWPGIYEGLPQEFSSFRNEPAFSMDSVTFCIWRTRADGAWRRGPVAFPEGPDPDGSAWMLAILDARAETYKAFAEDYYEMEIPLQAVQQIYDQAPLTAELVKMLNAEVSLDALQKDMTQIGYPHAAV
jgi:hypothetical protein